MQRSYRIDPFTNGIDVFCSYDEGRGSPTDYVAIKALLKTVNNLQDKQSYSYEDLYRRNVQEAGCGWSMDTTGVVKEYGESYSKAVVMLGRKVQLRWNVSAPKKQYDGRRNSLRIAKLVAIFLEMREPDSAIVINHYPSNADANGYTDEKEGE